jgi:hypothetical protein
MIASKRKTTNQTVISIVDESLLAIALKLFWLLEELPGRSTRRAALLRDLDDIVKKHFELAAADGLAASPRQARQKDARTRAHYVASSEF